MRSRTSIPNAKILTWLRVFKRFVQTPRAASSSTCLLIPRAESRDVPHTHSIRHFLFQHPQHYEAQYLPSRHRRQPMAPAVPSPEVTRVPGTSTVQGARPITPSFGTATKQRESLDPCVATDSSCYEIDNTRSLCSSVGVCDVDVEKQLAQEIMKSRSHLDILLELKQPSKLR